MSRKGNIVGRNTHILVWCSGSATFNAGDLGVGSFSPPEPQFLHLSNRDNDVLWIAGLLHKWVSIVKTSQQGCQRGVCLRRVVCLQFLLSPRNYSWFLLATPTLHLTSCGFCGAGDWA